MGEKDMKEIMVLKREYNTYFGEFFEKLKKSLLKESVTKKLMNFLLRS